MRTEGWDLDEFTDSELEEMGYEVPCKHFEWEIECDAYGTDYCVCVGCGLSKGVD